MFGKTTKKKGTGRAPAWGGGDASGCRGSPDALRSAKGKNKQLQEEIATRQGVRSCCGWQSWFLNSSGQERSHFPIFFQIDFNLTPHSYPASVAGNKFLPRPLLSQELGGCPPTQSNIITATTLRARHCSKGWCVWTHLTLAAILRQGMRMSPDLERFRNLPKVTRLGEGRRCQETGGFQTTFFKNGKWGRFQSLDKTSWKD